MNEFLDALDSEFRLNANPTIALNQKAYMKDNFEYLGLKSPIRNEIQKPFIVTKYLPQKKYLHTIIKSLWAKPEREFQYFAQELTLKYQKQFKEKDIELFEFMLTHKSWWDSVDFIAANLLGAYFKKFPTLKEPYVKKWLNSGNIWLQRSAVIFQLKYKNEVDTEVLSIAIHSLLGSKEFFINKAIGWSLRQYGKFNPDWVIDFTNNTELTNLSRKEALRLIRK
jgi:3-methyladenine DNA glycosylase AlkD